MKYRPKYAVRHRGDIIPAGTEIDELSAKQVERMKRADALNEATEAKRSGKPVEEKD